MMDREDIPMPRGPKRANDTKFWNFSHDVKEKPIKKDTSMHTIVLTTLTIVLITLVIMEHFLSH